MAQFSPYLPMPFCAGAETKTIPYAQDCPGKGCQEYNNKICSPGSSPDPPKKNENYQGRMKYEKKFVQESIHVIFKNTFYDQDLGIFYTGFGVDYN